MCLCVCTCKMVFLGVCVNSIWSYTTVYTVNYKQLLTSGLLCIFLKINECIDTCRLETTVTIIISYGSTVAINMYLMAILLVLLFILYLMASYQWHWSFLLLQQAWLSEKITSCLQEIEATLKSLIWFKKSVYAQKTCDALHRWQKTTESVIKFSPKLNCSRNQQVFELNALTLYKLFSEIILLYLHI